MHLNTKSEPLNYLIAKSYKVSKFRSNYLVIISSVPGLGNVKSYTLWFSERDLRRIKTIHPLAWQWQENNLTPWIKQQVWFKVSRLPNIADT